VSERFNGTLKSVLKIWCNEEQDNWDEYLSYALFAYNTSFHTLLQETPYFLMHGRDPKLMSDILVNRQFDTYVDVHGYGTELVEKLRSVYERVRKIYEDINEKRSEAISKVAEKHFEIGDQVLLDDPTTKIGLSRKLTVRWKGPYTVMEKVSDINYTINIEGKMLTVNKHRLRPYYSHATVKEEKVEAEKMLREEIERISEVEIELRAQKQEKQRQLEIARAQKDTSKDESSSVENVDSDSAYMPVIDVTESDIRLNAHVAVVMLF
jgi:hypothetical protein